MNIYHLLARASTVHRDRPAVALGKTVLHDFAALDARARAIAAGLLSAHGLSRGDRVAIVAANTPAYVETVWGIWAAGLAAVPVNAKLHPKEIAYILDHSGARVVFASPDKADAVAEARAHAPDVETAITLDGPDHDALLAAAPLAAHAEMARDDLAWLFYTSGTTGRPKGAMITHDNLLATTTSYFLDIDQVPPGGAIIHAAPMSHGSGLYMFPNVAMGAAQVIPESGGFDALEIMDLVAHWPEVSMFAAPTMINRLVAKAREAKAPDFSNLRVIIYGGAPMHVADVERALDVLGPRLAQLYGQGESPMCITGLSRAYYVDRTHPRFRDRIASAGFPQSVVEVRVVDENDTPLPPGQEGEIVARGNPVMKGYWKNPEATAETLRGGWLHTGDVGVFDEDGFLTLKDRSKDVIISGGTNIYPREVEEVLLRHPGVLECSVVGAPHADWGEEVVAFVVAQPGVTLDEADLDAFVTAEIARFKRPKRYRFIAELPKSNYGKILKRELRDLLAAEAKDAAKAG